MVGFIRSLFESALKTNRCLEFAVITGCLRISKESIFTGLNNLKIISTLSAEYAEHFGFTQKEVEELLEYYNLKEKKEEVKEWYNGYLFGNTQVYNPWSLINYVDSKRSDPHAVPIPYWSNTSSNSIVRDFIDRAEEEIKDELEQLLAGKSIEKPVHEDITYGDIYVSSNNLWNFLYFTGYLKTLEQRFDGSQRYLVLSIPNKEIKDIYENQIRNWFRDTIAKKDLSALHRGLLSGDAEILQEELEGLLFETISYMDTNQESFYHGFLLGIFMHPGDRYRIRSNRESGNGRYDICIYHPSTKKPVILIELKIAKEIRILEAAAESAIQQMKEKKYNADWIAEGYREFLYIGIGFYRKDCCVKVETVKL